MLSRTTAANAELTFDVALNAFGVSVEVRCTGRGAEDLAREVTRIWSRCLRADGKQAELQIEACVDPDPEVLAKARQRRAVAYDNPASVLHVLTPTVTVGAIDARRGHLVMLHAAGIALDSGDVIAFVAPSGTGKTTIATFLGRHFSYVTDETLAMTLDGAVVPYPKPLSVVTEDADGLKDQTRPDDLALREPPPELRLARIVLVDRTPDGPDVAEWTDVELLDGLAELTAQVSYLKEIPGMLHTLADLADSTGGIRRVRYREVASLLPAMESMRDGV